MTTRDWPAAAAGSVVPLLALLFLCFLQLLTDFVAGVYALGLLQTSIPPELACVLLLLAPVALLVSPTVSKNSLLLTGTVMLASRIASLGFDTRGRMLAAGVGSAAFLLFLPRLLAVLGNRRDHKAGWELAVALALAALLQILLRAMACGNDITGFGPWRLLGAMLAIAAGILLWLWGRSSLGMTAPEPGVTRSPGHWRIAGLCVGMMAVLTMLYLGLAAPSVMARWTDSDVVGMTASAAGAHAVFVVLMLTVPGLHLRLNRRVSMGWNLLFLSALGVALWSSRVPFPVEASAYPFPEPPVGFLGRLALFLTVLLSPVLYLDFGQGAAALADAAPSARWLAFGFTLGALWLLLFVFADVFTTVYDYVPMVGPLFRDQFWLVHLVAGAGAVLLALLGRVECVGVRGAEKNLTRVPLNIAGCALGLGAIAAAALGRPQTEPPPPGPSFRVMTFNLQQGYSAAGAKDFAGQLEFIRRVNPDIVGLQETDTARLAGGNSDLVGYLAGGLNAYACAGPRTGAGTFGIALLSRFPIERPRTFYLHSTGEQTAVLTAEIRIEKATYHVFVTHLGNGGPIAQQRQVLELVAGKTNMILIADFNFRPDAEPYRLTSERLADAWSTARERRVDPPHQDLEHRIDHIFLSPGMTVPQAEYLDPGVSDHPTLVVRIGRTR